MQIPVALSALRDQEAEQALLGCIMLGGLETVRDMVVPQDFYWPQHRLIYQACLAVADRGQPVDSVTVVSELKATGQLEKAGGIGYVASLATDVPSASHARTYAETVKNLAVRRAVLAAGQDIVALAQETTDVAELLAKVQDRIYATVKEMPAEPILLAKAIGARLEYLQEADAEEAIPTGFIDLDRQTGGLMPGTLTVLAARPGMGKSALGLQLAINAARRKKTALFISLEMTAEELADRVVAMQIGLDTMSIRKRLLSEADWNRAWDIYAQVGDWPMYLDCTPALTTAQIKARCRKLQAQGGLHLVVIDYLQRMGDKPNAVTRSRNDLVGLMTQRCKSMALEFKVPVLLLCQLNREVEKTADKRPGLAHLRESGEIEADADNVWFVYRPEYYWPDKLEHHGKAEVIIAKHRNGPTGSVFLQFDQRLVRFANLAEGSAWNG